MTRIEVETIITECNWLLRVAASNALRLVRQYATEIVNDPTYRATSFHMGMGMYFFTDKNGEAIMNGEGYWLGPSHFAAIFHELNNELNLTGEPMSIHAEVK